MQIKDDLYHPQTCRHNRNPGNSGGMALIAIGNQLRSDDGIARALCDQLPKEISEKVCFFDLGPYTYFLTECLTGHGSAIIIDSTMSDAPPGTAVVLNLAEIIDSETPQKLRFSHGFSLLDELRIGRWRGILPREILFVGIEAYSTDWGDHLSDKLTERLPELVDRVSALIERSLAKEALHA